MGIKFKFWTNNINGLQKAKNVKLKTILFQFNRFDNGFCGVYLRLFKKYSFTINGIKLKQGKRLFIGNSDFK